MAHTDQMIRSIWLARNTQLERNTQSLMVHEHLARTVLAGQARDSNFERRSQYESQFPKLYQKTAISSCYY